MMIYEVQNMSYAVFAKNVKPLQQTAPRYVFPKKVTLLDTTLRDGDQTPGVAFTVPEKLKIAKELAKFGMDIIEAGSPISSQAERDAVRKIREAGLRRFGNGEEIKVAAFARIVNVDIDAVAEAGAHMVSLVLPASQQHYWIKLGLEEAGAYDATMRSLDYALKKGLEVELLAEDGSRAKPEYLKILAIAAQKYGAKGFCVCDTVGVSTPEDVSALFAYLRKGLNIRLAFHGHNDSGLVLANTLAALGSGADEAHGTINGLGERTGNCPTEQIAYNLWSKYGIDTLDLAQTYAVSKMVTRLSKFFPGRNASLVGDNAFSHESGIHQNGMSALKARKLYEGVNPEHVGRVHTIRTGKLSGKDGIGTKLAQFNLSRVERSQELLERIRLEVNAMGAKGIVSDADFVLLVRRLDGARPKYGLPFMKYSGSMHPSALTSAKVRLQDGDSTLRGSARGDGPVDAVIKAIENAHGLGNVRLTSYALDRIEGGSDSPVRVWMAVENTVGSITSCGEGTDIVKASANAYMKALNALHWADGLDLEAKTK
jgi:(R)-citramalate synthase